jgi:HEAT repeat protein
MRWMVSRTTKLLALAMCGGALVTTLGCNAPNSVATKGDPTASASSVPPAAGASSTPGTSLARVVPPILLLARPTAYRFELGSASTLPGQVGDAKLSIKGVLWLQATGGAERVSLLAALWRPVSEVNGKPQPEFQRMVEAMSEGVSVQFERGVVKEMSVAPKLEPQIANLWRTITAALQHGGAGKALEPWVAREHDSTGEYEARYRWSGDDLVRTKGAYASLLQSGLQPASLEQLRPTVQRSEATLRLVESRLASLQMYETVASDLQKGVTMTVTTRLTLERDAGATPDPSLLETLRALPAENGHTTIASDRPIALRSAGVDQSAFDELRIKEWTFEQAIAASKEVEELGGDDAASDEEAAAKQETAQKEQRKRLYSAYAALTAFLRSRPETLPKAKKAILGAEPSAGVIVSALGDAGTASAQRLLSEVIETASLPSELRSRAIVRLGRTDSPVPEAVEVLARQLDTERLWGQALLALGIAGRTFRDAGRTADFDRSAVVIEGQLKKHSTSRDARLSKVLAAVSNLGDRRQIPLVRPLLEASDEDTRASAAFALRHMQDDEVDPLIARALAENGSTKSRLMILSAMRVRGPRPILQQALAKLLSHEQTKGQVLMRATRLQDSWTKTVN